MSNEAWMMNRESRRKARREAKAASTLRTDGLRATDVIVLDLSETGLRLAAEVELAVGQEISIGLAGIGARLATVAWARGREYGCSLTAPLTAEEAAQAFTAPSVIAMGYVARRGAAADEQPAHRDLAGPLAEIYARHRSWAIPFDAIVVGAAFIAVAVAGFLALVRHGIL